jgi:N-acetylglucosaminyldiphosphoundecaprenol N-acetyl-beta-D-mannosaminyltransferase
MRHSEERPVPEPVAAPAAPVRLPATVEVLDVPIAVLDEPGLVDFAVRLARAGGRATLAYANVHTLNIAYRDAAYRAQLRAATAVYCDGAGVTLGARLLGRRLPGRMTGADWIDPLAAACAREGLSLFLLGSIPGVAERAAARLAARHPALRLAGTHHGYLADPDASAAAVAAVNAARPDILLVGMGAPLQERWVAQYRAQLAVPLVWSVGALFDFLAGTLARGPRWMLDHGLEWLARFAVEPRRLWRRYLIGNPLFLLRILRQRLTRVQSSKFKVQSADSPH